MSRLRHRSLATLVLVLTAGAGAAAQGAAQTATEYYLAYRAALAAATSIDDLKPWHSRATRAKMDATPRDEAAMMFDIVKLLSDVTDLKVVRETTTETGVTLFVEAVDAEKAKATGEVFLVREDGGWKLERERWKS